MKPIFRQFHGQKDARVLTIPRRYFTIHEHDQLGITGFNITWNPAGIIRMEPVREK